MGEKYIFTMLGLNKYYGQRQVLNNINLCFYPGAKIGIVGENGAGKSTVLNVMAGLDEEFQGQAFITDGYKAGIVRQEPLLDNEKTVRESIEDAFGETKALMIEYEEVTAKMGESLDDDAMQKLMDRMGELQDKLDAVDAWDMDRHLDMAADALCLPADDRIVKSLSGGEKRRVALCKALLEKPDLLLLDEPTNHLDAETVSWLETQLQEYPGTVLIVTHDRYFLDNITKWILELDHGKGIPWEGNYSSWLAQKLEALALDEKKESHRGKMLRNELDWIRMSNKDRQAMSRARLADYEKLIAKETKQRDDNVITVAPGPDLGDKVIQFNSVSKKFDDKTLLEDMSFIIPRGAVVGMLGPNGTGKTTTMKMIVGDEKPDSGTIDIGSSVEFSYVEQGRESLADDKTLIDEVGGGLAELEIGKEKVPIRKYLARYGFSGASQEKKVSEFSGGERNRCNLAKVLKAGGNVLLLDEPTNDLDVNTLRMLEEAILEFKGCVLVVSHDRFFLDRICTNMLIFEGEGKVRWFEGNFTDYEDWRKKELGESAFENRRNRYRTLVKK